MIDYACFCQIKHLHEQQGLSAAQIAATLALDRDALRPAAERPTGSGDDEPVDLKAVFKQIWEVLS